MTEVSGAIRFAAPELFFLVTPLLLLLVWQVFGGRNKGAIRVTGLEYLRSRNCIIGRWRRVVRSALWGMVVVGLGVIWADPSYYGPKALFKEESRAPHKNFVVALDISPSMNLPATFKGYGGEDLKAGDRGLTRYEMARGALLAFLERFRGERFGLILFSTEPLFARWPTVETEHNFIEVLESIRRGSGTQLEAFSTLTNVDKALTMARRAFKGGDGAIILITDAEDDLEKLGKAAHITRDAGIRLYTIGVGIPDSVVKQLSDEFIGDPGFRIFRVDSESEMQEAYSLVARMEEAPQLSAGGDIVESDLRWLLVLILVGISGIVVWLNETVLHRSISASRGGLVKGNHGI